MIKLMQGDCLDLMWRIKPESIPLVLADPPYGTTAFKWDSVIDPGQMWGHLDRITKPGSIIALLCRRPYTQKLIESNPGKYRYVFEWTWNGRVEDVIIFSDKEPKRWKPASLKFRDDTAQKINLYQKPIGIMKYLVETYSEPGQTVLDFCMGSGVSGVTCKKLARDFIGIEFNKASFRDAEQWIKTTKQESKR